MGSSAKENLRIFQNFPRVPNIWGVQGTAPCYYPFLFPLSELCSGAATYAKMVTELIVRAKYQLEGKALKVIVGIQPEKFFFGMVSSGSLVLALHKPVTQMLVFPGEETHLDPGFFEAVFVEEELSLEAHS